MRRRVGLILVALGAFFLSLAPMVKFYVAQRVVAAPTDFWQKTTLRAEGASYLDMTGPKVRKNVTLASLERVAPNWVIDDIAELKVASDYRNRMRIRCSDVYQEVGELSGGNQQKVVLSKWLMTDPKVLILDEPTRGIDVGAKYEIYCIINELAEAGRAVVVISSEMPELLGTCDRICVMNDGAFVGEFAAADATQEKIMRAIMRNIRIPSKKGMNASAMQTGGMQV